MLLYRQLIKTLSVAIKIMQHAPPQLPRGHSQQRTARPSLKTRLNFDLPTVDNASCARLLTVQEMAGAYGKRARCTGTLVHSGTQTLMSAKGECRLPLYLKQRAMKYGWHGGREKTVQTTGDRRPGRGPRARICSTCFVILSTIRCN
jgi:hypothetical protein